MPPGGAGDNPRPGHNVQQAVAVQVRDGNRGHVGSRPDRHVHKRPVRLLGKGKHGANVLESSDNVLQAVL